MAVFKKAYRIYRERGYRLRLLSAAFRNHMHWSEFIGGDVVISPPYAWQVRYNASDIEPIPRMDNPVDPQIVRELTAKFPDFVRANTENGISGRVRHLRSHAAHLAPIPGRRRRVERGDPRHAWFPIRTKTKTFTDRGRPDVSRREPSVCFAISGCALSGRACPCVRDGSALYLH